MGFILYLCAFMICLFSAYLVIKISVRHAIKESLDDLKPAIREAVKVALAEYDWSKKNAG